MRTPPGIMIDNKVNGNFNLSVHLNEKREGFFIIHPDGPMNTKTSPILQNAVEQIFESTPEIIVFDMKQVNCINFRGLRVILKTIIEMDHHYGKVYLTNLQPHIKEVFDVIDALPAQRIFVNRHELDNYLDEMQSRCFGAGQGTIPRTRPSVSIGMAAGALTAGA